MEIRQLVSTTCATLVALTMALGIAACSGEGAKPATGGHTSATVVTDQPTTPEQTSETLTPSSSETSETAATSTGSGSSSAQFNETAGVWTLQTGDDGQDSNITAMYTTDKYPSATMAIVLSPDTVGVGKTVLELAGAEDVKDYDGIPCGTLTSAGIPVITCQTDLNSELGATITAGAYDEDGNPITDEAFVKDVLDGFKASHK